MKNKRKVVTTAAAAVFLTLLAISGSGIAGSLDSQNMAERWQADELKYSQISVFYPQSRSPYDEQETEKISSFIADKLRAESYVSDGEYDIWTDAYSSVMTPAEVMVYDSYTGRYSQASSEINITGIGGDFFEFHQLQLVSGNYIYDSELRTDRVVLDEDAAWDIFSSVDVTGMKILINKCEFEVAGVVRHEKNSAVDKAYPENPLIYVHYAALEDAGADNALLCYESVIPNPVSGFARNTVLEYFGINTMTEQEDGKDSERSLPAAVTENTGRYSLMRLMSGLKKYDSMFVSDRSIAYPYWENAARIVSGQLTFMLLISVILAVYISVVIIVFLSGLYLNRKWHLKDFLENLVYKYTYKKRLSDYISSDITAAHDGKENRFDQN